MQDRVETVRRAYDAFNSGDSETLSNLLSDADWHEAEGGPYGGSFRGFREVNEKVFTPIMSDIEDFQARPDEILPAGEDRVLVLGRYTGSAANGRLEVPFAHVSTVRDGRIVRFLGYNDTHKFREAVGQVHEPA